MKRSYLLRTNGTTLFELESVEKRLYVILTKSFYLDAFLMLRVTVLIYVFKQK